VFTARYGLNIYIKSRSDLVFKGGALTQTVNRRSFTADTRVWSEISQREFCGGHSGTGTSFSRSPSVCLPCQYHSTEAPYSSSSACCCYQQDKGTLTKTSAVSDIGDCWLDSKSFHF